MVTLYAIAIDDTYVYAGGGTQTVRKYLKSNLSYVGASQIYGGVIRAMAIDDTHIYVGEITQMLKNEKIYRETMVVEMTYANGGTQTKILKATYSRCKSKLWWRYTGNSNR